MHLFLACLMLPGNIKYNEPGKMYDPALIGVNSSEAHLHMRLVSTQKLGYKMEEKTDFL